MMGVSHVAIVGLGGIGCRHLRLLKETRPDIEVTLVRSGHGRKWPEKDLADRTVSSITAAVEKNIQAAIIATPANMHLEQAKELAQAGIHMLVEKPLSHRSDGIDQLIAKVQENEIIGMVGYVFRHHPAAKRFKKLFDAGTLGKPLHARVECGSYLPEWRPEQDYKKTVSASKDLGGGVLLELSHELDYIRWFLGDITEVTAKLYNSGTLEIDVEDSADLILNSKGSVPVSMHIDFNRRHPVRKCEVQGTNGMLTWNVLEQKISWELIGVEARDELFNFGRDFVYREQLSHFLNCIEHGTPPAVTLADGEAVLRLVEAAKISHDTGHRVALA